MYQIRDPLATLLTWKPVPMNIHICAKLWLYHNSDWEKNINISFLKVKWSVICKKLSTCTLTQGCYVPSDFEICPVVLERILLNSANVLSPFRYCLQGLSFIWTKLNPFHPSMLCANFGWNWPEKKIPSDLEFLLKYFIFIQIFVFKFIFLHQLT